MQLNTLSAIEMAALIHTGKASSVEVTSACLSRIAAREGDVRAFQYLDYDYALQQAEKLDLMQQSGQEIGPLHGVPVALKDIIDTHDMPTENGLAADKGRQPGDSIVATRVRAAGAVIIGKTTTTEAAYYEPSKTRNPHNLAHTPGGSSAGSAASVADHMVPLAIGSQTNGSVIRPASFNGVVGFKPGLGQLPGDGVLVLSPTLDHLGTFTRTIKDAALLAGVIAGDATFFQVPDIPANLPRLAFVSPPDWQTKAPADAAGAFATLCETLGTAIERVALPALFDKALLVHRTVMAVEMSENLARYMEANAPISDQLRTLLEEGQAVSAHDYQSALSMRSDMRDQLREIFTRFDAIITPASYGEAPATLQNTGDPGACSLWTLMGTPAITLPLLKG
ncbi:MAG: amidase, partial [Pseudomonadota bacterium]